MPTFHKNFPFGKGVWIWELPQCLGGNIDAIIAKMKQYGLNHAIVKAGDGSNTWDTQWTPELINKFHAAGLKIYSWSFIYGQDPVREADIASWALNMGADGHVFDAESQYEELSDPNGAAETMLQALRKLNPDAFLAHAPFPIISYHTKFPYAVFGKYCDAVMPQCYQGDLKVSGLDMINWMYAEWSKWEASVDPSSRKPIIPVAQAYDNYEMTPNYVLKPEDLASFIQAAQGYKSVNFYEFAHILRDDCWGAIRDNNVMSPTNADLGIADNPPSNPTPPVTETPAPPAQTNSAPAENSQQTTPPSATQQQSTQPAQTPTTPATLSKDTPVVAQQTIKPPATIKVTSSPSAPGGIKMQVTHHKPHIEYVEDFFTWIFSQIKKLFSRGGGK